eukprot:1454116-Amphidinium_carterae.1
MVLLSEVESGGGQWPTLQPQPLKYKKRRHYFILADPLEDCEVLSVSGGAVSWTRPAVDGARSGSEP